MKYKCDIGEWGSYAWKWAISKCLLEVLFNLIFGVCKESGIHFFSCILWFVTCDEKGKCTTWFCPFDRRRCNCTLSILFLEYYQIPWVCFYLQTFFYSRFFYLYWKLTSSRKCNKFATHFITRMFLILK